MRIKLVSLLAIAVAGCQAHSESGFDVSDVPAITPEEITRFDSTGEHFFSHLGYSTVVLKDGSVLLPDREENMLYRIDTTGQLVDIVAAKGRGPGEVQDILSLGTSSSGGAILYDQMNKKAVLFDEQGNYDYEIILPAWESGSPVEIHDLNSDFLLVNFRSMGYFTEPDQDPEAFLVLFDKERENYTNSMAILIRPYARYFVDGVAGGGRIVPYTAEDIRVFDPYTGNFYLYRSDEHEIVQIDHTLTDTLQTIPVDFQPEEISNKEIREIRDDLNSASWKEMQKLLPEYKALADDMMIDHQQNFWLKLNHAGEFQQWLIVSQEGELLQRVNLPKEAMLTHISEHHLGLRLDSGTFAFYEPVDLQKISLTDFPDFSR